MMRVLIIEQYSDLGGAQQCLLDLLPALPAAGWEATVAIPGHGPLAARLQSCGLKPEFFAAQSYSSGRKPLSEHLRYAAETRRLGRQLRRCAETAQPDLIYVNGPRLLPAVAWEFRRELPIVFHCHNHVPQPSAAWLMRRAIRAAGAKVIACCEHAAEPIKSAVRADDLRVVYNGVPGPDELPPRPKATGEICLGVVGRISPEKGQDHFLRAARMLAKMLPAVRFVICGEVLFQDPAARLFGERLHEMADGLDVEFTGWRDDLDAVYQSLDILVTPSVREPATTRVILEAYARGVPVVAYPTGGIPEVVEHGVSGFLTPKPEPAALAELLLTLILRSPAALEAAAIAGRQRWRDHFTVERYRRKVVEVMAEAARG